MSKIKQTVNYQKLVVPKRMRSPYWKYFGFPALDDGSILTQDKIICILCKKQLSYRKNRTNTLRMHLQSRRHKTDLMGMGLFKDCSSSKKYEKNKCMLLATSEDQVEVNKSVSRVKQSEMERGEIKQNLEQNSFTNVHEQTTEMSVIFQDNDNSIVKKKEIVAYQKLLVPKCMRSPFWKYFGFPALDNDFILASDKIICILCKTQISYQKNKKNISKLRIHLQNMHKTESMEMGLFIDSTKKKYDHMLLATSKVQVKVNETVSRIKQLEVVGGEINENFEQHVITNIHEHTTEKSIIIQDNVNSSCDMISKVVSDAITKFVISNLHLPDIVESKSFQELISTLSSPCKIPGKYKLEQDVIPKIYESTRSAVLNCIANNCGTFALGIEEWKCTSGNVYVTISVFFQQLDKEGLCIKQLATILCIRNRRVEKWCEILGSLFVNWNIKINQVKIVIKAFKNNNLDTALRVQGFIVIPCLLYELQNLCTTFCFETKEVSKVLDKCRTISPKVHDTNALTSIRVQNNSSVQSFNSFLSREYPQIWTTTFHFLERFFHHKDTIINLCKSWDKYSSHEVLTDKDWSVIEDVVTTLKPLEINVKFLNEQKMPLISLLKPLICELTKHLKVNSNDSVFAAGLKDIFTRELHLKYNDTNVQSFLNICTLLDPRFKDFPIIEVGEHLPTIKEELVKMVEIEGFVTHEVEQIITRGHTNVPKRARVSDNISLEDKLNLEITLYESEQTIDKNEYPLLWWSQMSLKYPNLLRLARKHFVYAFSGSSSKLPLESQILYCIKRSQFSQDLADKMLFINANAEENNS